MADGSVFEQVDFRVRFGWGAHDTVRLAPLSDLVVVVDVLRFTTAVTVAVERGAIVYPYRWRDDRALELAARVGAVLAASTDPTGPSLSPVSLRGLGAGDRLVLPSPNGATLSLAAAEHGAEVVAASLRNASAVGQSPLAAAGVVSVVAAGERWPDGGLRPCFEDLVGAGAVLSRLPINDLSPEARAAVGAFDAAQASLADRLAECGSGRELIAKGYAADVAMAAELDCSAVCPVLRGGAYVAE
jgi:2-phosphosulfolactate phosphatase